MFDKEVIIIDFNKVEAERVIQFLAEKIAEQEKEIAVLRAQKEKLEDYVSQNLPKQQEM